MRQEPQAAFPSSVLLAFSAIDEHASTNDFRFEETLSVFDGLTLQTLRKLSIERKASLGSHARQSGADLDALERKCGRAWSQQWALADHAPHTGWSSTLAALKATWTR